MGVVGEAAEQEGQGVQEDEKPCGSLVLCSGRTQGRKKGPDQRAGFL